ncbi:cbb3-type cytochrome oxidase assembly protein CcoS [Pseudomonas mangiferae]|uniref:Cbb3-type cytochrome oxidase assembly protein CcoS n=1 Tax=Pseudomonas mangiferae TaxID=2593654 RepID=A0A553GY02_9PSED|nr:cbb3-type cytochrome oxidase assembly protein CcoS [Pseudomonas mangiferae]TRX74377.1 cbb3-type cytochrome oxidase assembly protein CcoS [Pseudomonas mangiferae]
MTALYVMIPVAVIVVGLAIWLFFWAVDSGQYDDMDSPAHSILFDDEDPRHQAGVEEAKGPGTSERDAPHG